MVPGRTTREMPRLACTDPNDLSMPRSSITAARSLLHVVGDLDLPRDDVGTRLAEPLFHLGRDQTAVVLVERVPDPVLGHAQVAETGLPGAVLGRLERFVHGEVDALDHRGED